MSEKQKKIAITGANGVVGRALTEHLGERYEITPIDLPEIDVLQDQDKLDHALAGVDTVIHLAGVFGPATEGKENWRSPHRDPRNKELFHAVLEASKRAGADKFIHASSIHVEDTMSHSRADQYETLQAIPGKFHTEPASGYGHAKREQESDLEFTASEFVGGAVSIRLGGVRPNNLPLREGEHPEPEVVAHEQKVWIEHSELADLVGRIIDYKQPIGYDIVYAVSDNTGRFHDTTNRYGWQPTANSSDSLY